MNNIYIEIFLLIPPDESLRELILAEIIELEFLGFKETDNGIQCYIQKDFWSKEKNNSLNDVLIKYKFDPTQTVDFLELKEENWNKNWEDSLKPIEIGNNFIITQNWNEVAENNKIKLIIDPKMSFGTGFHETTRLMINQIESYNLKNKTVLDIGTGTGILSFACEKLNAINILGIDIDEWSISNANENKIKNNCTKSEFKLCELNKIEEVKYDFILANITKNTIIGIADLIKKYLSKNGILIISGFYDTDCDDLKTIFENLNFKLLNIQTENNWASISFAT